MREAGRLLVCATPIGNLGDVTLRVLETLAAVDTILAEDTRVTRKLLCRFEISAPLERFDEAVSFRRTPEIVERLLSGVTFALVSDAGTPGVSDPGATLVEAALDAGVPVEVLPGASAIVTALVASGLPTHAFYFGGFVPRKAGERKRLFAGLSALEATLIFYESPRRTAATLADLAAAFPARQGAMARELTKLHEEVLRGPLPTIAEEVAARESLKGEVVLLVGPPVATPVEAPGEVDPQEVRARVNELVSGGAKRTEAVKQAARELGLPRGTVYDLTTG